MRLVFTTLAVFAFIFTTASSIKPQSAIERAKRRSKLVTSRKFRRISTKKISGHFDWNKCVKSVACKAHRKRVEVAKKFNRLPQLLPNYVWMFSFGANVGSAVFKGTGVQSKFTFGAILHKHCLKFNSRVGEHKNVFANVIPAKNRRSGRFSKKTCVHGVIHMIRKVDLENIFDEREQCHVRRKVTVETYGGEKVNNVEVYYGNNGKNYNKKFSTKPEARYLKLIYCGGVERNLNGRYLNRIKSLIFGLQGGQEATGTVDCSSLKILKTPTNKNKDDKQKNTVRCAWG